VSLRHIGVQFHGDCGLPGINGQHSTAAHLIQILRNATGEFGYDWIPINPAGAPLIIQPSRSDSVQPREAYQPLKFEISSGNEQIDQTYLFKHALTFDWTFHLTYRKGWLRIIGRSKELTLQPQTSEPRVLQYAPRPGWLTVKVKIRNDTGDSVTLEDVNSVGTALQIAKSSDFGTLSGLAKVEKISWLLASIVAIVTGLSTFYFQDYLTLFLWGAGVDQGKNFLQAMQNYSPSPVKNP